MKKSAHTFDRSDFDAAIIELEMSGRASDGAGVAASVRAKTEPTGGPVSLLPINQKVLSIDSPMAAGVDAAAILNAEIAAEREQARRDLA